MTDYEFVYHSEIPIEFANIFYVEFPSKMKTIFQITSDLLVQEFENGAALCVSRDADYLRIHSNKPFNQTIPASSGKVVISFEDDDYAPSI